MSLSPHGSPCGRWQFPPSCEELSFTFLPYPASKYQDVAPNLSPPDPNNHHLSTIQCRNFPGQWWWGQERSMVKVRGKEKAQLVSQQMFNEHMLHIRHPARHLLGGRQGNQPSPGHGPSIHLLVMPGTGATPVTAPYPSSPVTCTILILLCTICLLCLFVKWG